MTYRNSKGKFISKEEWLSLQPKKQEVMNNNKKKRFKKVVQPIIQEEALNTDFVETINKIEDNLNQEWVGESGKFEIKEGTQVVDLGSDFDVEYKQQIIEFEERIEKAFASENKILQEESKEPIKTPGFFTRWLNRWIF